MDVRLVKGAARRQTLVVQALSLTKSDHNVSNYFVQYALIGQYVVNVGQ